MNDEKHIAERFFERLLRLRGYDDFEHEEGRPGARKKPDYRVTFDGVDAYFEVKCFDEGEPPRAGAFTFDPIKPVRAKIDEARPQFREFTDSPCVLVLLNPSGKLVFIHEHDQIYGAMFGDPAWQIPFDPATGRFGELSGTVFTKGGKMAYSRDSGPKDVRNTTFSAILSLYIRRDPGEPPPEPETVEKIGAFVFHNPFARVPLPDSFFRGPWDRVFGRLPNDPTQIGPLYVGENVPFESAGQSTR